MPTAAESAPAEPDSARDRTRWDLRLALDLRYDDNILQLSPDHIERLENLSPEDEASDRFSIETPDDRVTIPRLSSTLRAAWLSGRPTSFELDVSAHRYLENPIKNYESYRLSVSQPIHRRAAHRTSIEISYAFLPDYYLRNLISDRASEELGTVNVRKEATYRRRSLRVEIDQEVVTDRLWLQAAWGRERRDYNRFFDERDSRMPFREARLSWDPLGDPRLRLRASYRREDLHAAGDLSDTTLFVDDDVSSRRDIVAGDARLRWGKKGRRKSIRLLYEVEKRDYGTTDPNDLFHFERDDERRNLSLSFQVDLRKGWFLAAEAERERNRTDSPIPPGPSEPDDITEYTEHIFQAGFGYRFDLGRSRKPVSAPDPPSD